MHTLNKKESFGAPIAAVDAVEIMRLKVTNQQKSVIHAYTVDANLTVIVQYVLTDPISGAEVYADYVTKALTASTLEVIVFDYKVDHLRVMYHTSNAGSGTKTIQVTGTTSA
jgi:hypothetical protein